MWPWYHHHREQSPAKKILKSPWQLGAVSGNLLSAKTTYRLADMGSNHLHDSSLNRLGDFLAGTRRETQGRSSSWEPIPTSNIGQFLPFLNLNWIFIQLRLPLAEA